MLVGPTGANNATAIGMDEVQAWVDEGIVDYRGELSDVRGVLAECHVFVLPSLFEGLPLVLVSPLVGYALYLPSDAVPTTMVALALAIPTLSLVGGTMAALTVGLKRGGGLMSLLILPVVMPALIFGARATDLAATGLEAGGALNLLTALFFLALGLTPWAMASAMRISLD